MSDDDIWRAGSIRFDRIADDYDRTRIMPTSAMARFLGVLEAELRPQQPCLEIGVGTGRVAAPLAEAGIRMVGIDLSGPMLARLLAKAGGRPPFPLVQGDAARLPFRDHRFGSGVAVHVLHLMEEWRRALEELVRVIRPGGVAVVDVGGPGPDWFRESQERFLQQAGVARGFPGTQHRKEVDHVMASLGARARQLPPVVIRKTGTIREWIERIEAGVYSFTWHVDADARIAAAAAVRRWAEHRFGSLDVPRRSARRISWRAYDLPER